MGRSLPIALGAAGLGALVVAAVAQGCGGGFPLLDAGIDAQSNVDAADAPASDDAGDCAPGITPCTVDGGRVCIDLATDHDHCGSCEHACLVGFETCTSGACTSTCPPGTTLCAGDAGASDDGGAARCVNVSNSHDDCGACFHACPTNAECQSGACVVTLLGSGTANDPWRTPGSQPADCAAYHAQFSNPSDGVYTTHPSTSDIDVYCDMSGSGVTYESFGMGVWTKSYGGWTRLGSSDFANATEVDAAFAYLFTRDGLVNLDIGFTSSNCCFLDTNGTSSFGFLGAPDMYPASGNAYVCNPTGGYTAGSYVLYLRTMQQVVSSVTAADAANVGTGTQCSVAGNPAIFVKRY